MPENKQMYSSHLCTYLFHLFKMKEICSNEERCLFFSFHVSKPASANISAVTLTRKCTNLLLSSP